MGFGFVWEGEEGDGDFVGELSVFHDNVGAFDVVFEGAGCGVGEEDGVFFVRGVADEVGFWRTCSIGWPAVPWGSPSSLDFS